MIHVDYGYMYMIIVIYIISYCTYSSCMMYSIIHLPVLFILFKCTFFINFIINKNKYTDCGTWYTV
jgi:hypothetical protein